MSNHANYSRLRGELGILKKKHVGIQKGRFKSFQLFQFFFFFQFITFEFRVIKNPNKPRFTELINSEVNLINYRAFYNAL